MKIFILIRFFLWNESRLWFFVKISFWLNHTLMNVSNITNVFFVKRTKSINFIRFISLTFDKLYWKLCRCSTCFSFFILIYIIHFLLIIRFFIWTLYILWGLVILIQLRYGYIRSLRDLFHYGYFSFGNYFFFFTAFIIWELTSPWMRISSWNTGKY